MRANHRSNRLGGFVPLACSFVTCGVIYFAWGNIGRWQHLLPDLHNVSLERNQSHKDALGNSGSHGLISEQSKEILDISGDVQGDTVLREPATKLITTNASGRRFVNPMGHGPNQILQVRALHGELYGLPVAHFSNELWLLRNDGAIQTIPRSSIQSESVLPYEFEPISTDRLMQELRKEFGPAYLVQSQQPYVFVSKSNHISQWATRFRSLYDSMRLFCRTRGLKTKELDFPLIAIVFGSENEFLRYANLTGTELPPDCVGFYSQRDNRIALFEDAKRLSQQETLDTISHEAAHQLAFNMGLHRRCVSSGLWLAEGFATLFEAPEFSHLTRDGRSAWPASRRRSWDVISKEPTKLAELLDSLVRNDNLFQHDIETAYTVAWALTNYLAEREPRKFSEYVFQISQLPFAQEFSSHDRWIHFRTVFGTDASRLTVPIKKHIDALR